jgi:hypothetical protein
MDVDQYFRLRKSGGVHFDRSTVLYRLDRVRAVCMFDPSRRPRHDSDLWIRMIADQIWTCDTVKSVGTAKIHRGACPRPRPGAIISTYERACRQVRGFLPRELKLIGDSRVG